MCWETNSPDPEMLGALSKILPDGTWISGLGGWVCTTLGGRAARDAAGNTLTPPGPLLESPVVPLASASRTPSMAEGETRTCTWARSPTGSWRMGGERTWSPCPKLTVMPCVNPEPYKVSVKVPPGVRS